MNQPVVSRETAQLRVGVLGTGTNVGKTHVTVALVAALAARGERAAGLKPIESGISSTTPTDAELLARVSSVPIAPAPYLFSDPISPHLAARRDGVVISLDIVCSWADSQPVRFAMIESAGALLSPLGPGLTNADLLLALAPAAVVLVGVDRLGVLHDVSACLLALRVLAPALPRAVVALNPPASPDASTGTNSDELKALGVIDNVIVFPRAEPTSPAGLDAARRVLAALKI